LQFISKRISSNDRGKHRVDQAAAFAILNQQLSTKIFISPAIRAEWNETSGWEFVPQLNFSYRAAQFQLRASGGKTIRDADFTERYNNYNKAFVASGRIGNPDLVAENSWSYEAGVDYFMNKELKLSASFFKRHHSQLIDYVVTPYSQMPRTINLSPTGTYALAKNISKVNTTGVETELQYVKNLEGRRQLWATVGFVWLESKSSEATTSFYINSHARFLTNFNLHYIIKRLSFTINGIYKNRTPQTSSAAIAKVSSDYFLLNAKIEAMIVEKYLSAFVQADNVFDREYADLLGAQMPGRWLMGGIKISLSK
jgi:iron complex outermembrane receptor protein